MSDAVLTCLEQVLRLSGADETSLAYQRQTRGSSRFASNRLTQCVDTEEPLVEVRVAIGKRVGAARVGSLESAALAQAHRQAITAARARPEPDQAESGFPAKQEVPTDRHGWSLATAQASAEDRARPLRAVFAEAEQRKLSCAGNFLTTELERAVVSTRGIRAYERQTFARIEVIAADGRASGHSSAAHWDVGALAVDQVAARACERAERAHDPIDLPAGRYDVVLSPAAVAELLEWLGSTAFHARAILDGTSALAGRLGERIMGENVTIIDDPRGVSGATPRSFDAEGVPSQPVVLIEHGVARGYVSDTQTARRLGGSSTSTGHAATISDELSGDPKPSHLVMQPTPGGLTRDELVARLGRGLLITRFHYVNGLVDTRRATMTGLTRDGLLWIENGEPRHAVRNLRWTQSILEAFSNIAEISGTTETLPTWWSQGGAFVAPSLLVRGWTFTGAAG